MFLQQLPHQWKGGGGEREEEDGEDGLTAVS